MNTPTIYIKMKAHREDRDGESVYTPAADGKWFYVPLKGSGDRGNRPAWQRAAEKAAAEKRGPGFRYRLPNRGWSQTFDTIKAAEEAAKQQPVATAAAERGLSTEDHTANPNRMTIRQAIDSFLEGKDMKSRKTKLRYSFQLEQFREMLPRQIRFVDEITKRVLHNFASELLKAGDAPRTIANKMESVYFMLKAAGVVTPSKTLAVDLPAVDVKPARPYTEAQLKTLFDALAEFEPDNRAAFLFMLMTACREAEVAHATWDDIDWEHKMFHVGPKTWKDSRTGEVKRWSVKTHEGREVPLTDDVIADLKAIRKTSKTSWIFPNQEGEPEGHFLRVLKRVAEKAGLNSEEFQLHRLRKTRATWWHENGVSLSTIQRFLGHQSLNTTQIYLGMTDIKKLQTQLNKPMWNAA